MPCSSYPPMSAMPSIATTVAAHEIAEYNTGYANARSPLSNHLVTKVLDTAVKTRNEIALAAESWNAEVGVSSAILMLVVGALQHQQVRPHFSRMTWSGFPGFDSLA